MKTQYRVSKQGMKTVKPSQASRNDSISHLLGDPKPSKRADVIGRKDKQMFNSYVGLYEPEKEKAEVFAGFWSEVHAMEYVYQVDPNMTGNGMRDDRIMFMMDEKKKIRFYGTVGIDDTGAIVKTWEKYDDAQILSPFTKQIVPLENYGASKKKVTEIIRTAVYTEIIENADTLA